LLGKIYEVYFLVPYILTEVFVLYRNKIYLWESLRMHLFLLSGW